MTIPMPGRAEFSLLLERARAGDLAAFEQIMIRHQRQVYAVALRLLNDPEDARDAVQEVFLRLYRHLGGFDESRDFSAWLYRITVNMCRDMGRARRKHAADPLDQESAAAGPDPQALASAAQRSRILAAAIARLPAKERAALVLRDLEGLPTAEVAGILGSSEGTVRAQISSARLKIRKLTERFLRGRP